MPGVCMARYRYVHLMRVRRDPLAKDGWTYASVCDAIPNASEKDLRALTEHPNTVSCPICRRWIMPYTAAPRLEKIRS